MEAARAVGSTRERIDRGIADFVRIQDTVSTCGAFSERVSGEEGNLSGDATRAVVFTTETEGIAFFALVEKAVTTTSAETSSIGSVVLDAGIASVITVKI